MDLTSEELILSRSSSYLSSTRGSPGYSNGKYQGNPDQFIHQKDARSAVLYKAIALEREIPEQPDFLVPMGGDIAWRDSITLWKIFFITFMLMYSIASGILSHMITLVCSHNQSSSLKHCNEWRIWASLLARVSANVIKSISHGCLEVNLKFLVSAKIFNCYELFFGMWQFYWFRGSTPTWPMTRTSLLGERCRYSA